MKGRKQLETSIEATFVSRVENELGVICLKLNLRGNVGWPDRLVLIPGGRPLLIEFKRVGEDPRKLQAHKHDQLKKLKYDIEVHDTVKGAFEAVKTRLEDFYRSRPKRATSSISAR